MPYPKFLMFGFSGGVAFDYFVSEFSRCSWGKRSQPATFVYTLLPRFSSKMQYGF